tara:strand:- start:24 stop:356 length:333 start_codon:yes stop_codon:yes gene_type:complete
MIQRLIRQFSGASLEDDKTRALQLVKAMKGNPYYIPAGSLRIKSRRMAGGLAGQIQAAVQSTKPGLPHIEFKHSAPAPEMGTIIPKPINAIPKPSGIGGNLVVGLPFKKV